MEVAEDLGLSSPSLIALNFVVALNGKSCLYAQGEREMREVYRTYSNAIFIAVASLAVLSFLALTKDVNQFSWFYISPSQWQWPTNFRITSFPPTPITDEGQQRIIKKQLRWFKDISDKEKYRDKKNDEKLKKLETSLAVARALIREASLDHNCTSSSALDDDVHSAPHGDIYRNVCAFHRSYQLMEKLFKIFVYEDGDPPLFHDGPCRSIYAMEGLFINLMEADTKFRTLNPDEAHVFFLPFSVVKILQHLFHPQIRDKAVLEHTVVDYVHIISHRYPYWNRSLGVDHFMLSCHDWGPRATWYMRLLYFNSIRVLCNANTSEHYIARKDASFPEINLMTGETEGITGGLPPLNRTILAFFAGNMHGKLRQALFQHWLTKDEDILVYETLPEGLSYYEMMKKSRYCICPSGYEVASPRIAEAINAECVPVLISQHYVFPFSDVLNWDSFSIQVSVNEIPDLKKILLGIQEDRYLRMYQGVKQVQRHFVINDPPIRYDVFHMIIHSVWLRRLNAQITG